MVKSMMKGLKYFVVWLKFYHLTEEIDAYYRVDLTDGKKRKRLVLNYIAYNRYVGDAVEFDAITYAMYKVFSLCGVDAISKKEVENFFHV